MPKIDDRGAHEAFLGSDRPHVLQITNHGIHQWGVIPGLPDTGGQNVFVNELSHTLAELGFRVTIANRGGYEHPTTGEERTGLRYKDAAERILYLEDETAAFVRKEDMPPQTPKLAEFLRDRLDEEGTSVDLIISHYWDGARVGVLFNDLGQEPVQHIWVPHSLGAVKKRNVSPDKWAGLRIDERIAIERELVARLDGIAATSSLIRDSLRDDYGYESDLFLPPCVDTERFGARALAADDEIWAFLAEHSGLTPDEVRRRKIVTEISRTDTTKRKDVLIRAFARARRAHEDTLLVVAIDETEGELASELHAIIVEEDLKPNVAVVGNVWDILPKIYAVTYVYCSPSVMEGFGMAVEEAAATKVPVVGSDRIPFVEEYLLGDGIEERRFEGMGERPLRIGAGAIVVPADDVPGFAKALELLFADPARRDEMGRRAYSITVPRFTWRNVTEQLLEDIGWSQE